MMVVMVPRIHSKIEILMIFPVPVLKSSDAEVVEIISTKMKREAAKLISVLSVP